MLFASFFVFQRSALMALVFYNKGMLQKVMIQETQQFSKFSIVKYYHDTAFMKVWVTFSSRQIEK